MHVFPSITAVADFAGAAPSFWLIYELDQSSKTDNDRKHRQDPFNE